MLKDKLQSIFSDDYPGYSKFADEVVRPIFGKDFERYPMPVPMEIGQSAINANIQSINRIGIINDNDNRGRNPIEVFDVTINDNAEITRSRVNIQTWIRSELGLYTHAFIIFHYANPDGRSWRLSYLYKPDTISGATEAKRYTYLLGKSFSARTVTENFVKLALSSIDDKALGEAFSVQALSDDFFKEYRQLYADIIEYITGKVTKKINNKWQEVPSTKNGPNKIIMAAFKDNEQRVRDYIKKMMGRLTFMYFIQRKGWLCKKQNFMHELFFTSDKQDSFLDDVLEPLFFGVLNTGENREAVFAQNGWDMSLLEHWKDIKYLNGGLFEQTDDDRLECKLPKSCFENIFNFFDRYNFTIDENDPSDAEIGIDPEMLGRIFESLLEDNKDKGAFYTPKEIVQYMCKASLRQYLLTHTTGAEQVVTALVDSHKIETDDLTLVQSLDEHLKAVKICDPAIGSGAFPMGLLNEILTCRRLIHSYLHREDNVEFNALAVKREIIRNNIFGVDIEQGAVDIARLRFWLSIVVDTDEPEPLPNLDYTIVRGNSLITTFQGEHLNLSNDVDRRTRLGRELQQLFKLQEKIYDQYGDPELQTAIDIKLNLLNIIEIQLGIEQMDVQSVINETADTLFTETNARKKKKYQKALELLKRKQRVKASIDGLRIALQSPNKTLLKRAQTDIDFFDWNIMFSDIFANGGFDIVIGNPPYIDSETMTNVMPELREIYAQQYNTASGNWDMFVPFIELGTKISCKAGAYCFIIPNKVIAAKYAASIRELISTHSIVEIRDYSRIDVFDTASVYPCTICASKLNSNSPTIFTTMSNKVEVRYSYSCPNTKLNEIDFWDIFFLPPEKYQIILKYLSFNQLSKFDNLKINGAATVNEAYLIRDFIYDNIRGVDSFKVINTGTIDPYEILWGKQPMQYIKRQYLYPQVRKHDVETMNDTRYKEGTSVKLIVAGMSKSPEVVYDNGEFLAGKSTTIILGNPDVLKYVMGILNSKFIAFCLGLQFNSLKMAGGFLNIGKREIGSIYLPFYDESEHLPIINNVNAIISGNKNFLETLEILIYHLYGLSYDEVLIVDPSTPISREEYENNSI